MIPPFQELMLPILDMYAARDSESIANREFMETLAAYFHLTEADRNELLAGGRQSRFENRVYWALVYLRRAGLIESTGRGLNRITKRGHDILQQSPSRIDIKLLSQFPEFRSFRASKALQLTKGMSPSEAPTSPQEQMEAAFSD